MIEFLNDFDTTCMQQIEHAEEARDKTRLEMEHLISHPPFKIDEYMEQVYLHRGILRCIDSRLVDLGVYEP